MLPPEQPDRIQIAFDDHRLVANAGLILPVTLAHHLGLGELVDRHVDLGGAPGRANVGDKMLTLVASALAGGDCIDDADALRAGGTDRVLGCVIKAPSTLGTFPAEFPVGPRAPAGSGEPGVAGWAWAAGAGPGDEPLTIDLDSTICETYGLAKEGAHDHGYTGQRGLSPAVGRGRWHRRRADGTAAPGTGQHGTGRRPTSCGRRWVGCAMPVPRVNSPCGPTAASTPTPWSPSAARRRSASPSPPDSTPSAQPHRGHTRG